MDVFTIIVHVEIFETLGRFSGVDLFQKAAIWIRSSELLIRNEIQTKSVVGIDSFMVLGSITHFLTRWLSERL